VAKVLNVEKIQSKVRFVLDKFISSKSLLEEIGKFSRERIYSFAKSGKSLFGNDDPNKIKPLSKGYINYRRKIEKVAPVGPLFSPGRSNLTFTGQMLNALIYKIKSKAVEVFVKDSPRDESPKLTDKPRKGPRLTNAQVAAKLAKEGRPFIGMDRLGRERIKKIAIKELRKAIRSSRLHK
jgi:hypothetical protein